MIKCNSCKRDVGYRGGICEICGAKLTPSEEEIVAAIRLLDVPASKKSQSELLDVREFLAVYGHTESQREYAKYLERTDTANRSFDLAMKYYYLAALKNDPFSAYRYSRLVNRTNEISGSFWLKFSGAIGCIEAYPELTEYYSAIGREDIAAHFCSLAAECDDTQSIVGMAKRYLEGLGVQKNESFAKWYLDKFTIPPISAFMLSYKLRGIKPTAPSRVELTDKQGYLDDLADDAKRYKFHTAYYKLISMLSNLSGGKYTSLLGILTAEGIGCEANKDEALRLISIAADSGDIPSIMYMGDEYCKEDGHLGYDTGRAISYYERAARLGHIEAYVAIGDLYRSGKADEDGVPNIKVALGCYQIAEKSGSEAGKAKAEEILTRREELYRAGIAILNTDGTVSRSQAKEAYRALAIASAYGHTLAYRPLAKCYAWGFGCEKNRPEAFRWFSEAAEAGDKDGVMSVGICYAKGFGVGFSYKLAIEFLQRAEKMGVSEARGEIALLKKRRMNKAVRSVYATAQELVYMKKYDTALRILTSFKDICYPKAVYLLGLMHEFGLGTVCDTAMANQCYQAARAGSPAYGNFIDEGAKYKSLILKMIKKA